MSPIYIKPIVQGGFQITKKPFKLVLLPGAIVFMNKNIDSAKSNSCKVSDSCSCLFLASPVFFYPDIVHLSHRKARDSYT